MLSTNTLERSQKYLDLILELFKRGSLTARLDSESMQYNNADGKIVKVLTVKTTGLGNYEKDVGYPQGAITAEWVPLELACDRGVKFLLDRIDDDEVLGLTIGKAAQVFTDYEMIPELDAYRFAKYFDGAGKIAKESDGDELTHETILGEIDKAAVYMNGKDVPTEGRILYVNQDIELMFRKALNRVWANDSTINTQVLKYNGMDIIYVPNKRFQTLIELNDGADDEWGYKVDPASESIGFMLLQPKCVVQAAKTAKGKFISADEPANEVDSHKFLFRIYHDAFVVGKLKDGVYAYMRA
jgi:hypothetical protein